MQNVGRIHTFPQAGVCLYVRTPYTFSANVKVYYRICIRVDRVVPALRLAPYRLTTTIAHIVLAIQYTRACIYSPCRLPLAIRTGIAAIAITRKLTTCAYCSFQFSLLASASTIYSHIFWQTSEFTRREAYIRSSRDLIVFATYYTRRRAVGRYTHSTTFPSIAAAVLRDYTFYALNRWITTGHSRSCLYHQSCNCFRYLRAKLAWTYTGRYDYHRWSDCKDQIHRFFNIFILQNLANPDGVSNCQYYNRRIIRGYPNTDAYSVNVNILYKRSV